MSPTQSLRVLREPPPVPGPDGLAPGASPRPSARRGAALKGGRGRRMGSRALAPGRRGRRCRMACPAPGPAGGPERPAVKAITVVGPSGRPGQLVTGVSGKVASPVLRRQAHTASVGHSKPGGGEVGRGAWTGDLEDSRLVGACGVGASVRVGRSALCRASVSMFVTGGRCALSPGLPGAPSPAAQGLDCGQPDGPDPFPASG